MNSESAALIAVASVQALATLALVAVTILYVREGRRQADAAAETARFTKNAVLDSFRPLLTAKVQPLEDQNTGLYYIRLKLANDGRARAALIGINCWMNKIELECTRRPGVFIYADSDSSADFELVGVPKLDDRLIALVAYKDVFDRLFATTHKLHIGRDELNALVYIFESEKQRLVG